MTERQKLKKLLKEYDPHYFNRNASAYFEGSRAPEDLFDYLKAMWPDMPLKKSAPIIGSADILRNWLEDTNAKKEGPGVAQSGETKAKKGT